ncbi:MAG TPA: ATP-binding protein [Bacteroidia bacterium]|jgi:PAS domain S-box-containing protein|nr:ATP-binding protein [Bacteroidia bacterium]
MRAIDKNITKYASIQAFAVVMVALGVLFSWFFSITLFKRPLAIWVSMNPATAIAFICSGTSFLLLNTKIHSKTKHILASVLAGCVCFIGILRILESVTHIELGLDSLLYAALSDGSAIVNAMSSAAAVCFIMIGFSLFLLNMDVFPKPTVAHLLAFTTAAISLFSLLCILFNASQYGVSLAPLSLNTSLCFLFISISVLFIEADKGLFKEFTGKLSGNITAKYLIPVAIVLPVLFGYLRIHGEHMGWFSAEFGSALYSIILVCISILVIHFNSKMLNKRDIIRNRIEERLETLNLELETRVKVSTDEVLRNEKIYQTIASNIPNSAIFILDKNERFTLIEGDIIEKLGYSKVDMQNKKAVDVITPNRYEVLGPLYKRMLNGETFSMQRRVNGYDLFVQYVPLMNKDGEVEQGMIISVDITDVKKAENEIRELNSKLEKKVIAGTEQLVAANKELEAFSYSVSHDLRAPLRAVDGYTRMIQEDYGNLFDEEGKRLLETVQSNAKRMGTLIDDLLAFSRLGKKDLLKTEVNMTANASSALTEINKTVDHRSAIMIEDLHNAQADYGLINQVFINLISNAIKYSAKKDKPIIRIHSEMKDGEIIYSVADNGAGFDMRYVNKLFGVFQRLHGIEDFEGTGVGLAIVKRIITKHGGRVWAEGKSGEGATFYFTLPLKDELNG